MRRREIRIDPQRRLARLSRTGIIARENADAIYLRTTQLAEIRIARKDVEAIGQAKISIMPEGLEKAMNAQQLSDLLEFLYHCR